MRSRTALAILACAFSTGCAFFSATPVPFDDRHTAGFRVYDPIPLLLVTDTAVQVVTAPDLRRGYAVKFSSYWAKNASLIEAKDGVVSKVQADLDSTGALTLFQSATDKLLDRLVPVPGAAGAAGEASLSAYTLGLKPGLYMFEYDDQGRLLGLTRLDTADPKNSLVPPDAEPRSRTPRQRVEPERPRVAHPVLIPTGGVVGRQQTVGAGYAKADPPSRWLTKMQNRLALHDVIPAGGQIGWKPYSGQPVPVGYKPNAKAENGRWFRHPGEDAIMWWPDASGSVPNQPWEECGAPARWKRKE